MQRVISQLDVTWVLTSAAFFLVRTRTSLRDFHACSCAQVRLRLL